MIHHPSTAASTSGVEQPQAGASEQPSETTVLDRFEHEARLLGVQIANGYSSEAAVFARLLGARRRGFDAQVIFHESDESVPDARQFETTAHCDVVRFDTGWRRNPGTSRAKVQRMVVAATYVWRLRELVQLAARFEPNVVYSSQQHYDCRATTVIAHRLRLPQIVHLHYNVGPWLKNVVLERLVACDHVIAVSDFIRKQAIEHGVEASRVTTIHNSLAVPLPLSADRRASVRKDLGVPLDAYVVGMVSRLDPSKGHVDTISAFSAIGADRSDAWLVIAGTGTDEINIRSEAVKSAVGQRIVFTGHHSDVPALLGAFDAFAHPSRMEPFGLAILEALAAGLPVVAYDEGGVREIITSGRDGVLVTPGDVAELADVLASFHDQPSFGARLSDEARSTVATSFRPQDAAQRFGDVVARVASGGTRARQDAHRSTEV